MTNEKNKPAPGKQVGCLNKSTQKVSPQVKTDTTVFIRTKSWTLPAPMQRIMQSAD